jgi:C-terminal processing protease CtpA/Prc
MAAHRHGQAARAYLEQMIGFMQAHSINRLTIDWTMFHARVFDEASSAQTIADTYPAIRVALGLLGDGHSSYRSATGTVITVPNRNCSASGFSSTPTLPNIVGYVKVGPFAGVGAEATGYANEVQRAIASADRDDLIGWIVDVRGNTGGNMWPMVVGVGPVLGEGVIGYFIDPTGVENVWEYRDGAAWHDGVVVQRVDAPYRLRRERPRVAVLTDNSVASSGEATVIAFRRRPDTRSFGAATCGLSTANQAFAMSDGATLALTVSVMADRTRTKYGDSIPPDEIVTDPRQLVQRALEWLQSGN